MRAKEERPPFGGLLRYEVEELFASLPTPAYVIDEARLLQNGRILGELGKRTGAGLLLAQKAFSCFPLYDRLAPYAAGTEASGLYEARLGYEKMPGKEVHVFCGAYREEDMPALTAYADHVVFNTPGQLRRLGPLVKAAGKSVGLRINPECSTQEGHAIYDPCAPGSRLGTPRELWEREMGEEEIALLDGLHFHTLCEQDSDALEKTLDAVFARFGEVIPRMKWVNLGGGHHITREGYDTARLERCIKRVQEAGCRVYLEPGEAWALNAGYLVTRVLDVFQNGKTRLAIIDASAACHMPDVLEMPYVPPLYGCPQWQQGSAEEQGQRQAEREEGRQEKEEGQERIPVRLGGPTCLAGDVIGTYGFPELPRLHDLLVFGDMAIYTMCKNNTFNGMPLPPIYLLTREGELKELVSFGYEDFAERLGR